MTTSPLNSMLPPSLAAGVPEEPAVLKACCALSYENPWVRLLLGESFHPGGLELTGRLGTLMNLGPDSLLLDVACGAGGPAVHLAREFGCSVIGMDLSGANLALARTAAVEAGVADRVQFRIADAERLPLRDGSVDAVLCECAFCVFPDKAAAAAEFARVLRPGGRLGLSDLAREGELPPELDGVLAWIACVADALPTEGYVAALKAAGFTVDATERHDAGVRELIEGVRLKLLGAQIASRLGKVDLPPGAIEEAKGFANMARTAARDGRLGYVAVLATYQG